MRGHRVGPRSLLCFIAVQYDARLAIGQDLRISTLPPGNFISIETDGSQIKRNQGKLRHWCQFDFKSIYIAFNCKFILYRIRLL